MEVVLAALHQAQCQREGKQPVPSSPWLSHGSLCISLPGIPGRQDVSRRGLQPVGCLPGGYAPYPYPAQAELTVIDLFFLGTPASKTGTKPTSVKSPLHPLPISWPFLNCRPRNVDQSLAQAVITKPPLRFSCK